MNPEFFKHKMAEVRNFLQIIYGKVTRHPEESIKGVDGALDAMKNEKKVYLREKKKAEAKLGKTSEQHISSDNDKVLRESGDISAI